MPPPAIKKTWRGYSISYDCPGCGERLKSSIDDAGNRDQCPECNAVFTVPGVAERERLRDADEQLKQLKEREKAEQRDKRERQVAAAAKSKEDKRLAAEAAAEQAAKRNEEERLKIELEREVAQEAAPPTSKGSRRLSVSGLVVAAAIGFFVYPMIRNSSLRSDLARCPSLGTVSADVYYRSLLGSREIVFDVDTSESSGARRIDLAHLLMQFAAELDLYDVNRIYLARDGEEVFFVTGSGMRELVTSYSNDGEIWAFNNLPSRTYRMSGSPAYQTWEGGWIGVLKEQAEDLADLLQTWLGG